MIDELCCTDRLRIKLLVLALLALSGPVASGQQLRVFMARDGEQAIQPVTGNTSINMLPGETARIGVFLEDTTPGPMPLSGYQLMISLEAQGLPGAGGSVVYVDNNPGQVGGDSIFLDTDRTDWLFFGLSKPLMIFYGESVGNVNFGLFFFQPSPFPGVDPAGAGIRYLMEFDFVASVNAHGTFELPFNIHPEPPPLAVMFGPFGGTVTVDEWQALTIHLPHCRSRSDCADDDPCTVETCADGVCQYSPTSCTDNDPCTTDQCDSAVGCFFMPFDCTDFNSCTTDECNALDGCVHVPACVAASDCDDADYCTNEVCTTSGCCVYEPLDCHDDNLCTSDGCLSASGCINEPIDCGDGNQCLAHECDLATGLCEGLPINTGQACDDGDDCTIDDVCTPQGTCAGQPLLNCTPLPAVSGTGMAALCVLLAIGLTIRRPDQ